MQELPRDVLTDGVIKSIQDMIWSGELTPGDLLPSQQELAARYGVGLSTIREAMKALSLVGLVEIRRGKGTRVLPDALKVLCSPGVMRATLRHVKAGKLFEARAIIEVALTRMAAERASAEDIVEIEAALGEMRATVHDDKAFSHADMRFHQALAKAAKNSVLEQLYYLTRSLLLETTQRLMAEPEVRRQTLTFLSEILLAVKARQPIQAQQASERHITYTAELLRAELADVNP